MSVNLKVDLTPKLGPTREQGARRTCMAFALSELNRFHNSAGDDLSVEFLYCSAAHLEPRWTPHAGMTLRSGISVLTTTGQPLESAAPYANVEPTATPPPIPVAGPPFFKHQFVSRAPTTAASAIIHSLDKGSPVGLSILVTPTFLRPNGDRVPFSPSAYANSYHSVVACGHGTDAVTGERLIKLKNSWGPAWGSNGQAWVTAQYIDAHATAVFEVP